MIEELEDESLIAEVIMSHDSGQLVVVVEGDLDSAFVSELALPGAAVVIARGKRRILAELDAILRSGTPVLFLLDRDFDFEMGQAHTHRSVVYTERYNLEATLLLDRAIFDRLWELNLRPNHRVVVSPADGAAICEQIATMIGKVRFVSVSSGIGLNLDEFPIRNIIDLKQAPRDVKTSEDSVILHSLTRSGKSRWLLRRRKIKEDGYLERAHLHIRRELRRSCSPGVNYVSGHDAARILNLLLQMIRRTGVPSASELEWQALHEAKNTPNNSLAVELRNRASERGFAVLAG